MSSPRRPATARRVAVLVAFAGLAAACGTGGGQTTTVESGAAVPLEALAGGDPLPEATLPLLASGGVEATGELDMGALEGPAVVNFWATWCAFCVEEMPEFEQVHRDLDGRVRFVGVDREDNPDAALAFLADVQVTYDVVEDVDGSFFTAVKGRGMPTTLFVDAEGVIRHRHAGPMTGDELRALIAEHLDVAV